MKSKIQQYIHRLTLVLTGKEMDQIALLGNAFLGAWKAGQTIYFCGNGGSAGNASHLANDFIYGAGKANGLGLRVESLSANTSVLTCLGNDLGYENIYSEQLRVKANPGDILVALSGSGNSPNIVRAIEMANNLGMTTFAILGYSGGICKKIALHPIHFEVDDMQIAEDLQLIVGHICMQWLAEQVIKG
jgi:D-sedoheptulose 7-phosphate isomerase